MRDRFPQRPVVREVQGVTMTLPWSHRLPDYARDGSPYGQNLVELAAALAAAEPGPLTVLDIGANVGDSALQVLDRADARVLCVEADPVYLRFLHTNVDADPRCTVVPSLLTPVAQEGAMASVRSGGTAHFVPADEAPDAGSVSQVTPEQLRAAHPEFDRLRLVKSDTDGYDVDLVPAVARVWADQPPVLFFEYDHVRSRAVGNDPEPVWAALAGLGYDEVAVWDNFGEPLGRVAIDELPERARGLDDPRTHGCEYWDVALAHRDDAVGVAAVRGLVTGDLPGPPQGAAR